MQVLVTGGTGLIERHLIPCLLELGCQIIVVTYTLDKARQILGPRVTLWKGLEERQHLNNIDAVINLTGEPTAGERWSARQGKRSYQSRQGITQGLVGLISASETLPSVLVFGSTTSHYGGSGEVVVTEGEPPRNEFAHRLCARWEQTTSTTQSDKTRMYMLRTGVALVSVGDVLTKMVPPFHLGLGGPTGNGRQYMAWIHVDGVVDGIIQLLNNNLRDPLSMASPYPVYNEQFAHTLSHASNHPAILHVPTTVMRLLVGKSSVLVLGGQHASPKRLEASGFMFCWHDLEETPANIIR